MAEFEDEIVGAGAEIVWVLEQTLRAEPGTAETCRTAMDGYGSSLGWCVGDGETQPTAGVFDESPFAEGRGFDILVDTATMEITWVSSHGTPSGNDNLDGASVLAQVRTTTGR